MAPQPSAAKRRGVDMKIEYADAISDVLTSVLNSLQFNGKVFCYGRFTAPWAIRINPREFAHFHFVERGEAWIQLEETGARTRLISGDLYASSHQELMVAPITKAFGRAVFIIQTSPMLVYGLAVVLAGWSTKASLVLYAAVSLFFLLPNPMLERWIGAAARNTAN